jgi:phage repressor protein C with HTH and peptisase S24 domain
VLFVDSTVRAYDGDGIYIIARGNDVQVKRLQKLNGDVLAIISDNRAYESERLTGEDAESVVICGRVLAAWTIRKFW